MINTGNLISASTLADLCAKSVMFKEGYDSYMKGKPFDYAITDSSAFYERGRLFAIYTQQLKAPRATWRQGVLSKTARERIVRSCMIGFMR